jgi:hypothetical protein
MFWRNMSLRSSSFQAGFLLSIFFNAEVGAKYSSEKSLDFQQTTWCYIPEGTVHFDNILQRKVFEMRQMKEQEW